MRNNREQRQHDAACRRRSTGLRRILIDRGEGAPPAWSHAAAALAAVNALLLRVNAWPAGGSDGQRVLHALRELRQRA